MKKALNISLILLIFTVLMPLSAQKYAIEFGYSNPERYGSSTSTTFLYGAQLGGTATFDLKNNFSLLTGALYSFVYSDRIQAYVSPQSVNYKTQGHFVDIPIRAMYTLSLNKNLKLLAYAGPKINIGLLQRQQITSSLTYPETHPFYIETITTDLYENSVLNRINLQIGLGGGVQWKNYQLRSGYDWGINNLNKLKTGNLYQKGWYVSFAYQF